MSETIKILAARKGEAIDKIDKANRRLAKAGIAERFSLTLSKPYADTVTTETGFQAAVSYVDATLSTPSIGYNGWTFVATLSFEEGGTVVRTVPGMACDFRPTTKECDHCHTVRERNETFVVRNEAGEYKQVGRNCLAIFLGVKPQLWVLGFEQEFRNSDEGWGSASSADYRLSMRDVVAAALAASNEGRAYVSAQNYTNSTKNDVADVLWGKEASALDWRNERGNWIREMRAKAQAYAATSLPQEVIEAVRNMRGNSEYAENCKVLANSEWVDVKNLGLVVSFVKVYANAKQYEAERKAKSQGTDRLNEYFGSKGEKIAVEGVVTFVREIDGMYGTTTLIEWVSPEGYTFKWFATGVHNVEVGSNVKVTGTIKDHDEYNGRKATLLTRCKVA